MPPSGSLRSTYDILVWHYPFACDMRPLWLLKELGSHAESNKLSAKCMQMTRLLPAMGAAVPNLLKCSLQVQTMIAHHLAYTHQQAPCSGCEQLSYQEADAPGDPSGQLPTLMLKGQVHVGVKSNQASPP